MLIPTSVRAPSIPAGKTDDLVETIPEIFREVVVYEGIDAGVSICDGVEKEVNSSIDLVCRNVAIESPHDVHVEREPAQSKHYHHTNQQTVGFLPTLVALSVL